jgi:sulfite reductase alpha subunit-like flavoprotein
MADFREVKIPLSHVLEVLPPLRRRQFSIASNGAVSAPCPRMLMLINKTHPGLVQLLVAIVNYKTNLKIPRQGSCTSWLKTLKPGMRHVVL